MRVILALLFVALAMLTGRSVLAQSPNASISGVVLDPDKKSIADAEILVVNDYTRVQYEAKSNAEGFFAVTNLPPGQYRVQVSKVGFKAIIKPDIILNVQDALAITFTLPIGSSSVVVTVEGGAPMINTTDAAVSTVVDRQFAENLPLNGRSFQSLIYLTAGAVATSSTTDDSGQFSINGQRAASNYWMVDGVSANIGVGAGVSAGNGFGGTLGGLSALGGTNSLVSVDAMEEFRIQTSTFAPEFGRTPGGQISILTRSGTNRFHGTAFDYLRNDAFDANNWFNGYQQNPPLPKAEERQNDFGGTLGGPILKDRTFFFFSYEGLRLRLPQTTVTTVPDLASRDSAVPAMQPYFAAFPLPNGPDNPATGAALLNASYSNPATLDAYSLRIDHKLGTHWTLFGRYSYSPSESVSRGASGGVQALSVLQPFDIRTQTATAGLSWNGASNLQNDLRFNYSHNDAKSFETMDNFRGAVPLTALPFPEGQSVDNSLFEVILITTGSGIAIGKSNQNVQRQWNVVDSLAWQKGSHGLKFGLDFRRLSPVTSPLTYLQAADFLSVSDMETGFVFSGFIESRRDVSVLFKNLGVYAQDSWRALPRLTVTYGVRWDVDFAPSSIRGPAIPAVTGYNLSDLSQLAIAPTGTAPFRTTYGNFAPRIGLAYQFSQDQKHQTVLRGGFGVFYDLVSAEAGNLLNILQPPFGNYTFLSGVNFPFDPALVAPPAIPETATLNALNVYNPHLKLPYVLQWNVALDRALGANQTISATYLGASGRRLLQTTVVLDGDVSLTDNAARSSYNALQVQFQRRLSHGLQALASYSWAHSIDTASASSVGNRSNLGTLVNGNQNRGDSDFDVRNAFASGVTYAIPSPGKHGLEKAILGDWSVESLMLVRSATPVDLQSLTFRHLNDGVSINIRPDVVPGQPLYLYSPDYPGGKAFNPAAFENPPADPATGNPTRQGNLGRNVLRGFGATQWDWAVHRDFPIRESMKLQFRGEMFNLLNHPNFGPPNGGLGSSLFGIATQTLSQNLSNGSLSGGLNPLYQIGGPRSMQFALKLFF